MKIVFLAEIKEKEKLEFLNHSSKLRKYLRNVLNLYSFAKRQREKRSLLVLAGNKCAYERT